LIFGDRVQGNRIKNLTWSFRKDQAFPAYCQYRTCRGIPLNEKNTKKATESHAWRESPNLSNKQKYAYPPRTLYHRFATVNNLHHGGIPIKFVYANEMSLDRIIFRAVHQSLANKRNENIIHPLKIHREILKSMAGLTCVAHLLNASKKMATSATATGENTSLGVEDIDRDRLEHIDVDPQITGPEQRAMGSKRFNVDEIEFMILIDLALPFRTHPRRPLSLSVHDSTRKGRCSSSKARAECAFQSVCPDRARNE
jgi:hypothetical protein